jgi:hypothetical protein
MLAILAHPTCGTVAYNEVLTARIISSKKRSFHMQASASLEIFAIVLTQITGYSLHHSPSSYLILATHILISNIVLSISESTLHHLRFDMYKFSCVS